MLTPSVDRVVALILVVQQRRVVPHFVGELAEAVLLAKGSDEPFRARGQRSLELLERLDALIELA